MRGKKKKYPLKSSSRIRPIKWQKYLEDLQTNQIIIIIKNIQNNVSDLQNMTEIFLKPQNGQKIPSKTSKIT